MSDPIPEAVTGLDGVAALEAVIGIPTFRRPAGLDRVLRSLEPSARAHALRFVIADNGCDPAVRDVVAGFARRWPFTSLTYLAVRTRGISHNRNALIGDFLGRNDGAAWLAMIDDDMTAPAQWLTLMLRAGRDYHADCVGGPCAIAVERPCFVVAQSMLCKRRRFPSGRVPVLHAGGNVLLSRAFLNEHPSLRFDPAFGLSGGEDYDFFQQARRLGARFAWCDEAFCPEHIAAERLNSRYVLMRYFTSGVSSARSETKQRSLGAIAAEHGAALMRSVVKVVVGAVSLRREQAISGLFMAIYALGGLWCLTGGGRMERYR